jgi:hypothetical protein
MTTSRPGRQPLWQPSKERGGRQEARGAGEAAPQAPEAKAINRATVVNRDVVDWYVAFAGGRGLS